MSEIIDILIENNILKSATKIATGKKSGTAALNKNATLLDMVLNATSFLTNNHSIVCRLYCIIHDITDCPTCPTCQQPIIKFNSTTGFQRYCSAKCAQSNPITKQKIAKVHHAKYGCHPRQTDEVKQKQAQTNIERYGVSQPLMSKEIRDKGKQTNVERYGAEYYQISDVGKGHINQTNIIKYGAEYPFKSPEIQQKVREQIFNKYGVQSTSQLDWVKEKQLAKVKDRYDDVATYYCINDPDWLFDQHHTQAKTLTEIAFSLGLKDEKSISNKLTQFNIPILLNANRRSIGEQQLSDFLTNYDIPHETNNRLIIQPKELDVYIPEHKLAIEYCGLYWHSDNFKPNNYHKIKYEQCKSNQIRLITLYEDEWKINPELIKLKILSILGKDPREKVYARKCIVVNVSTKQKTKFFDEYHIQGSGPGSINIGLQYNGELVTCMSFIKQQNGIFVLNRYATSKRVIGGFSKLLKHFKLSNNWTQIVSFADLRWSQGELYEQNGFKLDNILSPDYYYVVGNQRHHKFGYRHKLLEKKLPNYDPNLSEKQNCDNAGLVRIWDCGKLRYVINSK
jgi:hypothetical protein